MLKEIVIFENIWSQKNYSDRLYVKQNGLCLYCLKNIENMIDTNIHHIYELKECKSLKDIKTSNSFSNLVLLHSDCHRVLHSKNSNLDKKHLLLKTFNSNINKKKK